MDAETRESLIELGLNILAPTIVLIFLSGEDYLGPELGLGVGLSFPILHSARSLWLKGSISPLSVIAVVSVLLTGGIGLLELEARWFVLKEGGVSIAFAVLTVASLWSPWPAVEILWWIAFDEQKVRAALADNGQTESYQQDLTRATWGLGAVMFAAAGVTWALAAYLVTADAGTTQFNEQLGRYTFASFAAITFPSMGAMLYLLNKLMDATEDKTGLHIQDLRRGQMSSDSG
jgi:hypothetical protein